VNIFFWNHVVNSILWSTPNQNVKNIHKHILLDLIRFTPCVISRGEIVGQMDLSRADVTSIINDLMATGIICEAESQIICREHPPIVLQVNPTRGVDFGATHLDLLVADISSRILEEVKLKIEIQDGSESCLADANTLLRGLLTKTGLELNDVLEIGVGVPGPIVTEGGVVIAPPIMPSRDRHLIRDTLQSL
jgi:hypothetical protein